MRWTRPGSKSRDSGFDFGTVTALVPFNVCATHSRLTRRTASTKHVAKCRADGTDAVRMQASYQAKLLGWRGKRKRRRRCSFFFGQPPAPCPFPPLAWWHLSFHVSLDVVPSHGYLTVFPVVYLYGLSPEADETSLFGLFVLLHQSPTAACHTCLSLRQLYLAVGSQAYCI